MGNFGPGEFLIIGVLALLIFGPQRLPEIARSAGRALREFKRATSGITEELKASLDDTPEPPRVDPAKLGEPKPPSEG